MLFGTSSVCDLSLSFIMNTHSSVACDINTSWIRWNKFLLSSHNMIMSLFISFRWGTSTVNGDVNAYGDKITGGKSITSSPHNNGTSQSNLVFVFMKDSIFSFRFLQDLWIFVGISGLATPYFSSHKFNISAHRSASNCTNMRVVLSSVYDTSHNSSELYATISARTWGTCLTAIWYDGNLGNYLMDTGTSPRPLFSCVCHQSLCWNGWILEGIGSYHLD